MTRGRDDLDLVGLIVDCGQHQLAEQFTGLAYVVSLKAKVKLGDRLATMSPEQGSGLGVALDQKDDRGLPGVGLHGGRAQCRLRRRLRGGRTGCSR